MHVGQSRCQQRSSKEDIGIALQLQQLGVGTAVRFIMNSCHEQVPDGVWSSVLRGKAAQIEHQVFMQAEC